MSGSLCQWPIFSLVQEEMRREIKWACVFGPSGSEAVLLTRRDELYALGSNASCCLGLGHSQAGLHPRKVEAVSGKALTAFAYGSGPHIMALTAVGELYGWGHNGYGQLGVGTTAAYQSTPTLTKLPNLCKVAEVACGSFHTIALTNNKEVLAWGFNNCGQLGCGDINSRYYPTKVSGLKDCAHVICGQSSSYALTSQGEIFSWGQNSSGQLGIGSTINQLLPTKVDALSKVTIKQMVSGQSHTLALTDGGNVFSWGGNNHGQLGNGNRLCLTSPEQLGSHVGKFADVAATHVSHISAGVLLDGKVLMWGLCRNQNVLTPLETTFCSPDEVFAAFSFPQCSWRPFTPDVGHSTCGGSTEGGAVLKCIRDRFNDPDTGDLVVMVDNRSIHVHKAILRIRCPHFDSMLQQGRWQEGFTDTIVISDYTYPVYCAFLKFLYTDQVDCPLEDTIGLLELADSYCEDQLKELCEQILMKSICVDNAIFLYSLATRYKAQALQQTCFRFILGHTTAVIQSTAFHEMDGLSAKSLIIELAQNRAFAT